MNLSFARCGEVSSFPCNAVRNLTSKGYGTLRLDYLKRVANLFMANVEFMKGAETGVPVHGEFFAMLKELLPNNLNDSVNENQSRTNPSNFRVSEDTEL